MSLAAENITNKLIHNKNWIHYEKWINVFVPVQAGILRCHPDLAGKLAQTGSLSAASTQEQREAGLLDATEEERRILDTNNQAYKTKFGFPFVICVRQNKKEAIMREIVTRLRNNRQHEVKTGIEEVKKIGWIRICDIMMADAQL